MSAKTGQITRYKNPIHHGSATTAAQALLSETDLSLKLRISGFSEPGYFARPDLPTEDPMSMMASPVRALLLSISVVLLLGGVTQGADPKAPKTDAAKIANAMSAAPAAVSRNASVVEMSEDGSMKVLRKGTGEWTCVPDDPSTPGNDPMCLDPNAMEWLHAYVSKAPPPDKIGIIYMLKGGWDFSNTDPFATKPEGGKATITGPHVMVVGPGVKSLPGYDRTGEGVNPAIPYVMWKDTPYEHLMIPVR